MCWLYVFCVLAFVTWGGAGTLQAKPPEIQCPADRVVACKSPEGATVEYDFVVTATCPGDVTKFCDPPSGSLFATGIHIVSCRAVDKCGEVSECSFKVTVECAPAACLLECPPSLLKACTEPGGAVVTYGLPQFSGNCPNGTIVQCDPPSGALFPLGGTVVRCKAVSLDSAVSAECSFTVTVECHALEIQCPDNIQVTLTEPGASAVHYSVPSVSGVLAPVAKVECKPASGSLFDLGITPVLCTASTPDGTVASCTFYVAVLPSLPCVEFQPPQDIVTDCHSPGGVRVDYPLPIGTNLCEGVALSWTCIPPPGEVFPPGSTTVQCWGWSVGDGETANCEFNISINGKCPEPCLALTCPPDRVVSCQGPRGTVVDFEFLATNSCNGSDISTVCIPRSGSIFQPGRTRVECGAWGSGQSNRCAFFVTVDTNCAPAMGIVRFGRDFVITWPVAEHYVLQQTTNFPSPKSPVFPDLGGAQFAHDPPDPWSAIPWQDVPVPPRRTGNEYSITLSMPTLPAVFYRLYRLPRFIAEILEVRFYTNLVGGTFSRRGTVLVRNTGDATWTAEGPGRCMLGVPNPREDSLWPASHRIPLPRATVEPGETVEFPISIEPPAALGNYSLEWRMLQEFDDSIEWFGDSFFYYPIAIEMVAFPEWFSSTRGLDPWPLVVSDWDRRVAVFLGLHYWKQLSANGSWSGLEQIRVSDGNISLRSVDWMPGIAVAANRDGRLEAFGRSFLNSDYRHSWQQRPGSPNWTWPEMFDTRRRFLSIPVVAQNADGRLEVFGIAEGPNRTLGSLLHNWQITPGGAWEVSWPALDGVQIESLNARYPFYVTRDPRGNLRLLYRQGNSLKHIAQTGIVGTWTGVESIPGPPAGLTDSMATTFVDGRLHVFAVLGDSSLWYTRQDPGAGFRWYEWTRLIAHGAGHPVVGEEQDGRRDLFMMVDGSLYRLAQRTINGPWSTELEYFGGTGFLRSIPAVAQHQDGRLEVFVFAQLPPSRAPDGLLENEYRVIRRKQIHAGVW